MILELLTNPLVILLSLTIIITILMYVFVGRKKKSKSKKVEKVYDEKSKESNKSDDAKPEENVDKKEEQAKPDASQAKDEKNIEGFDYIDDADDKTKEKKVSKVYVRKLQEQQKEEFQEDSKYQQLSERAEFVKTSKNVSKLSKFRNDEDVAANEEVVQELKKDIESCDTCNEIKSRFDRSRRLSKSIKDDNFDNMFASHITEHYLKIDAERHVSATIEEDIYKRANELVKNGETRALDAKSQVEYNNLKSDKDKLRYWLEHTNAREQKEEVSAQEDMECLKEEFKISLRNLILTESILKRKGRK